MHKHLWVLTFLLYNLQNLQSAKLFHVHSLMKPEISDSRQDDSGASYRHQISHDVSSRLYVSPNI